MEGFYKELQSSVSVEGSGVTAPARHWIFRLGGEYTESFSRRICQHRVFAVMGFSCPQLMCVRFALSAVVPG